MAVEGTENVLRLAQYVSEPREVADVVRELRDIDRRTGLERTLAIGRLVLQRFFGGSPEIWHERRKNKNNSVRRVAEHPDCPLSRSALNEAIGVYVAVQALPCVQTSDHITASHVAAVTFLDVEDQRRWLERAERENWSVRALKERVRADRHEAGERRGRPRVEHRRRLVAGIRSAVGAMRRAVDAMSGADLDASDRRVLAALADQVAVLQAELRFQNGPALTKPCAGPGGVAKVDTDAML